MNVGDAFHSNKSIITFELTRGSEGRGALKPTFLFSPCYVLALPKGSGWKPIPGLCPTTPPLHHYGAVTASTARALGSRTRMTTGETKYVSWASLFSRRSATIRIFPICPYPSLTGYLSSCVVYLRVVRAKPSVTHRRYCCGVRDCPRFMVPIFEKSLPPPPVYLWGCTPPYVYRCIYRLRIYGACAPYDTPHW